MTTRPDDHADPHGELGLVPPGRGDAQGAPIPGEDLGRMPERHDADQTDRDGRNPGEPGYGTDDARQPEEL